MEKKPVWITSRLCCGLGNRLFQITAAIGAAEKLGIRPVLFLPAMQQVEHGNFDLLQKLCPNLDLITTAPEWEKVGELAEERTPEIPPTSQAPIVLYGFFQNTDNFPELTNKYLPSLPSIPSLQPKSRYAVHFRFGDYRILPHHQMPGLKQYYYYTITTYIPKGSTLVLFSDSPEMLPPISEEIRTLGYSTEIFPSLDTMKTLEAFAECEGGAICSNSTFAWWAAFFTYQASNKSPRYKAYFPDIWIQGRTPPKILTNLPFTQSIELKSLPPGPSLESFHY